MTLEETWLLYYDDSWQAEVMADGVPVDLDVSQTYYLHDQDNFETLTEREVKLWDYIHQLEAAPFWAD